jgi:hypothetical protein
MAERSDDRSQIPEDKGHFDIRIDRDGILFYHGSPITRNSPVRLFARALRRDSEGRYWFATPRERGWIAVEGAPFVAAAFTGEGRHQIVTLTTNIGESFPLDDAHPLRPRAGHGRGAPYVYVRNDLEAKLSRPGYYQLVERAERRGGLDTWGVWSAGRVFVLDSPDAGDGES